MAYQKSKDGTFIDADTLVMDTVPALQAPFIPPAMSSVQPLNIAPKPTPLITASKQGSLMRPAKQPVVKFDHPSLTPYDGTAELQSKLSFAAGVHRANQTSVVVGEPSLLAGLGDAAPTLWDQYQTPILIGGAALLAWYLLKR